MGAYWCYIPVVLVQIQFGVQIELYISWLDSDADTIEVVGSSPTSSTNGW
jgi:hypothetical protein